MTEKHLLTLHGQMRVLWTKKSTTPWTILDPAIGWKKNPFLGSINLKTTIFEHFCQKHSILVIFSAFTPFVRQKGPLFYCERVHSKVHGLPPPLHSKALFCKWPLMLEKIWPPLRIFKTEPHPCKNQLPTCGFDVMFSFFWVSSLCGTMKHIKKLYSIG